MKTEPGSSWSALMSKNGSAEFVAAFSPDVSLETSVMNAPVVGIDAVSAFFAATAPMVERLDFTAETVDGHKTYYEWQGQAFGRDVGGATIVTRNAEGLIENIRLYHRPLGSVIRFSAELAKRLVGQVDREMFGAEANKALVLEAFDQLFNRRDYAAAERFWSPQYIQHSAHIPPGREGLFDLVRSLPATLRYEPARAMAEGDFVMAHGRFSGIGLPMNQIAADILRIKDGRLAEHWDVIQDEATRASSKSGRPMFGDRFAD